MAQELIDKIRAAAQASNVDPDVAVRIAQVESSLNPAAQAKTSSAKGLFQVIDSTWKQYGGKPGQQKNPDENIRVGMNILADNTSRLRSALGRDPSASELYAAHFFGAGAAPAVLSASPDTPISELLSQRAVKANPQLQGKTAGEVRQMLQAKMGEAPVQPKAAPSDGREGQPDFEAIGRGQMTADLGSGYKAALALSFLNDEEESEDRALDEDEKQAAKQLADYKSFNALNELEFGPSIVPLMPQQTAQAPEQVQRMADGGEVEGREMAELPGREDVSFIRAANKQKMDGKDLENLMLGIGFDKKAIVGANLSRMSEGERDNLARSLMAAYNTNFGDLGVNAAVIRPLDAPPGVYMGTLGASYPLGQGRIMGGVNALRTPDQGTQTQGYTLGYAGKVGPGFLEAQMMQPKDFPQARMGRVQYRIPFADGGEVEGAASQMLKQVVPMDIRTFGSTLFGSREPITEKNFTADELAAMQKAVDTAVKRTGQTQKGSVQYVDYPRGEQIGPDFKPVGQTLGRFTYEKQPDGTTVIRDRYDFYNEGRKGNVEAYEKMGRGERAMTVSGRALKNLLTGNLRGIPDELADAYIGREGRDVTIQLPPVRRAGGGDAEPTPEEIAAASRPATFNPQIARQGAAARQLAAMRDVNTLPDPRTYAAVSGFLGTPPDQQGFSVMHPDIAGIKKAGDVGFGLGTAAQVAPLAGAVRNLAGRGTTQASKALEGLKNIPVGASTKNVEPIFQHLPSAEAPFVGRLDEFVAGLPGSVQKDQFLGMLKGKFRDYDIARAQETLSDLPGNAKIAPVELLNRIKTQYDPSQFKTTVLPPGKPGEYYQSMDNIYFNKDLNQGEPLGVIHLSQNLPPQVLEQQMAVKDAGLAISRIATQGSWSSFSPEVADSLVNIVKNPAIPLSEGTASKILGIARDYRNLAQFDAGWEAAKQKMLYPILDSRYNKMQNQFAHDLADANPGTYYYQHFPQASALATKSIVDEGNQWLVSNGIAPISLPDFVPLGNQAAGYAASGTNARNNITNVFDRLRLQTLDQLEDVKKRAVETRTAFGNEVRGIASYMGQHESLGNPPSPISFSRFSEQVADIPGLGKREGIYINELQSDLLDDLRKFGSKGGTKERDESLIVELNRERKNILEQKVQAQKANQLDEAARLDKEVKILEKKAGALMNRLTKAERGDQGMYELPQAFAGMESSPQATQQLMAKNAIIGAIQQGKSFVAFPGAESAQAQLYEKLPRNLRDVVKDLGPGFELRDIKLTTPEGKEIVHPGVVWGPEAAARLQKKGVPFKDGGLVERRPDDSRKYL